MPIFRDLIYTTLILTLGFLLTSGCFSHPRVETVIHDGEGGSVFLKEFPVSSFRADHPKTFEPQLIRQILWGIRIYERKTMIESTLTGDAKATPAFTFEEVNFLTPLLVSAFKQVTAAEAVHFRVKGDVSGKRFDTAGIMFVKGEELNFSLTEYGLTPQRPGTLSQPTKSFDRPKRWSMSFSPISAVVNPEEDKQVVGDENVPKPLLISLKVLKQHAETFTEDDFKPSLQPEPKNKDQTKEEMEQEIERLRKTMQEQEERLKRLEHQIGE